MFGQAAQGNTSFSGTSARMFRFEVKGLRQTDQSDRWSYPIRRSGNAVIAVPYNRLNEEMQRINRLGGTIVSIEPLSGGLEHHHQATQKATAAHAEAKVTHAKKPHAEKAHAEKGEH